MHETLRRHFGFERFQPGQAEVITDVLAGRPTLAVMPTGAGKSLLYQLPALMLDGPTVVVSPLVALMRDQVEALRVRGVAADFLNATLDAAEQKRAIERLVVGQTRLIYVAPERFRQAAFVRALTRRPPSLFAVDEAHCISQWGHDFRPDYLKLGEVLRRLAPARVLACTATATPEVRADIVRQLGLVDPAVHVRGFLRTNLFLEARGCGRDAERLGRLLAFLADTASVGGAVVVYAATRKRVERYAAAVAEAFGPACVAAYHAGLPDDVRERAQARFTSGEARIVVATTAFGMGIDRRDVRAVVHVDLPRNLEGYYQEVGRGGRDGRPARGLLLYGPDDTDVHERLIAQSHPEPGTLALLWKRLTDAGPGGLQPKGLAVAAKLHESSVEAAVRVLERSGVVTIGADGLVRCRPRARLSQVDHAAVAAHAEAELERLQAMVAFAHGRGCRHAALLSWFGEPLTAPCPGCDRCRADEVAVRVSADDTPTADEILIFRKALAGVARADGRHGLRPVAAMLAGLRGPELAGTSLATLSTFGLLTPLGLAGCTELLQALVAHGLCRLSGRGQPGLALTPAGADVMHGRATPAFRPPLLGRISPLVARRRGVLLGGGSTGEMEDG